MESATFRFYTIGVGTSSGNNTVSVELVACCSVCDYAVFNMHTMQVSRLGFKLTENNRSYECVLFTANHFVSNPSRQLRELKVYRKISSVPTREL